ncbi:hypothetical protein H6A07_05185 [Olsenella uli]|uniref:hypothetical protein n=1 Tax=Olsenella uli TaxID=133926 RepID=UPI00195ED226|nr:hypothetical protein [Olsenella uli]MBM6676132.1 hypothetical protein [Olsenella uli]
MSPMGHSEVRGKSEISDVKSPSSSFDPDARVERPRAEASGEYRGGSYRDVFVGGRGDRIEVHHMPADEVNGLERNDGPSIAMDKADHRMMSSTGASKEAREYRAEQLKLIESGDFKGALKMDIDDIHGKCGDKYDGAIQQMLDYAESKGYISDQKGLLND